MNTMQFEFDTVVTHLVNQGKASVTLKYDRITRCAYRGENNTSCAVGCRILDELYTPEMEGKNVPDLIKMFKDKIPEEIIQYQEMFVELQKAHDTTYIITEAQDFAKTIIRNLDYVARKFELKLNLPSTAHNENRYDY